jgi:DNA-binding FadR family transcriptional regulator
VALAAARRTGLFEQVIEQLLAKIRSDVFPLDEQSLPGAALAATFGVGGATVREAVGTEAQAGLLEARQGNGTFARAIGEMARVLGRVSGSELREVVELRRVREVEGARLAAARRNEAEFVEVIATLWRCDSGLEEWRFKVDVDADAEFHRPMVQATHNSLFGELYPGVDESVLAGMASTMDPDTRYAVPALHAELLSALADRDVERAAREPVDLFDDLLDTYSAAGRRELST